MFLFVLLSLHLHRNIWGTSTSGLVMLQRPRCKCACRVPYPLHLPQDWRPIRSLHWTTADTRRRLSKTAPLHAPACLGKSGSTVCSLCPRAGTKYIRTYEYCTFGPRRIVKAIILRTPYWFCKRVRKLGRNARLGRACTFDKQGTAIYPSARERAFSSYHQQHTSVSFSKFVQKSASLFILSLYTSRASFTSRSLRVAHLH